MGNQRKILSERTAEDPQLANLHQARKNTHGEFCFDYLRQLQSKLPTKENPGLHFQEIRPTPGRADQGATPARIEEASVPKKPAPALHQLQEEKYQHQRQQEPR